METRSPPVPFLGPTVSQQTWVSPCCAQGTAFPQAKHSPMSVMLSPPAGVPEPPSSPGPQRPQLRLTWVSPCCAQGTAFPQAKHSPMSVMLSPPAGVPEPPSSPGPQRPQLRLSPLPFSDSDGGWRGQVGDGDSGGGSAPGLCWCTSPEESHWDWPSGPPLSASTARASTSRARNPEGRIVAQ